MEVTLMNKLEKYQEIFITTMGVKLEDLGDLKYNDIPEWDSIGHMSLMSEIEEAFEIFLEVDDIINFSTYKVGIEILNKYNVGF